MAKTSWSIDEHRIVASLDAMFVTVTVDGGKPVVAVNNRFLGEWPIAIGSREMVFKRVRNIDVARSELWAGNEKIPPSEFSIPRRAAPAESRCAVHPTVSESYREAGAPSAVAACGECRSPLCAGCLAPDGVRCRPCFDRASQALVKSEQALRRIGYIAAYVLSLVILAVGVVGRLGRVAGIGASCIVLTTFLLVRGLLAERRERRLEAERKGR